MWLMLTLRTLNEILDEGPYIKEVVYRVASNLSLLPFFTTRSFFTTRRTFGG